MDHQFDAVTVGEFTRSIDKTTAHFTRELDQLRQLVIQLNMNATESALSQHRSVRGSLDALTDEVRRGWVKFEKHEDEDAKRFQIREDEQQMLDHRVLAVEERQGRIMWLVFSLGPSMIAAWEGLKHWWTK